MKNPLHSVKTAFKEALSGSIVFPGSRGPRYWGWPSSIKQSYVDAVGDGLQNSALIAVVNWMARTFPEAPIEVLARTPDKVYEPVLDHGMTNLIEKPNPFYSGDLLWMATIVDYAINGNAYWLKRRNSSGKPVELWYTPSWLLEPKWDDQGKDFISYYEYKPDGRPRQIDVKDIVHFRFGLDPRNPRKGLGALSSLVREIFTDDEAAVFSATILKNMGIPGVVIAPDSENAEMETGDAEVIKEEFMQKYSEDKRGMPMVLPTKTKISILSFSPEQLDLKGLRRLPEERVAAVVGIPAIVAGLGAGLDRSTFTNFKEAREMAYESNIIPTQRVFSSDLRIQLLPDFDGDPTRRVGFNLTSVRVLQDDLDKIWDRVNDGIRGGWLRVDQGFRMLGRTAGPELNFYLRQITQVAVSGDTPLENPMLAIQKAQKTTESVAGMAGEGGDTKKDASEILLETLEEKYNINLRNGHQPHDEVIVPIT